MSNNNSHFGLGEEDELQLLGSSQPVESKVRTYYGNVDGRSQQKNGFFFRFVSGVKGKILPAVAVMLIILVVFVACRLNNCLGGCSKKLLDGKENGERVIATKLPKIVWVYTRDELQSQPVDSLIYFYYLNQTAIKNGYDVRVVNSWNAYEWIEETMARRIELTMQYNMINQTVDNLLKLALLVEYGGIMIGNLDCVLQDFQWLQRMFADNQSSSVQNYTCSTEYSRVFMVEFEAPLFGVKYYQNFIAALPRSSLLYQSLNVLIKIMTTGIFQQDKQLKVMRRVPNTSIDYLPNSIQNSVSFVVWSFLWSKDGLRRRNEVCLKYGIQSVPKKYVLNLNDFAEREGYHLLFSDDYRRGEEKLMINANTELIRRAVSRLLTAKSDIRQMPVKSVMFRVLQSVGNRQVFFSDIPPKKVQLCLIIMDDLQYDEPLQVILSVRKQNYNNWRLIMFAKERKLVEDDKRIVFLESELNQIRNIQIAVTKHCQPKGYALLLNRGEFLGDYRDLGQIAKSLEPRHILGAAIGLEFNGAVIKAESSFVQFRCQRDSFESSNIALLQGVLNHFRIFSVDAFRYIPQFQLRDIYGRYYSDRLVFLLRLLSLIGENRFQYNFQYIYRKFDEVWDIPLKAVLIDPKIRIKTEQFRTVNVEELKRTMGQLDCESIGGALDEIQRFNVPFEKLVVFNRGDEFVGVNHRKGPNLIPRVIHQIYFGSRLSVAEQYFFKKASKLYPGYEMKVWNESSLTKQMFPLIYGSVMRLIGLQKGERVVLGRSAVVDLMRYEILYHEGGFWRDMGMNLLRPMFDSFLKYRLVVGTQRGFRARWSQWSGFIAVAPKSQNLLRTIDSHNLNRMKIYADGTRARVDYSGFRQLVDGYQQYDPDILMLPFEIVPSSQQALLPSDLCTKSESELKEGQSVSLQQDGCYLLSDCQYFYPYALGLVHDCFRRTEQGKW